MRHEDDGDLAYDTARDNHATGDCGGIGAGCSWCRQEAEKRTRERNAERLEVARRKLAEARRAVVSATKTKTKREAEKEVVRLELEVRRLETLI